jgi:nitrite reductase/ring-hydroxylating ferredoxin subunit
LKVKNDSQELPQRCGAICSSNSLTAGGLGVRFEVADENDTWPAFVVRHSQGLAAYINRCAHLALELDWNRGLFFDVDQRHLICATHGALYTADTGECVSGPCNGSGLEMLQVLEREGNVYLNDPRYGGPCREAKARGGRY